MSSSETARATPPIVSRGLCALSIAALTLAAPACTIDDDVVTEIGTTVLFVADSSLRTQVVTSTATDETTQVVELGITQADLELDGTVTDLTFGEGCAFRDTPLVVSVGAGRCASGIVIDANEQLDDEGPERPVSLTLAFEMWVRRAEPLELPLGRDYDGDGVSNEADNCPLVDNPDQSDSSATGFGDACGFSDPLTGVTSLDNDLDGVVDSVDNCSHEINPSQEDTEGLGAVPPPDCLIQTECPTSGDARIPDAIGDACAEQTARVLFGAEETIRLETGPENLEQPLNRATFLIVDLRSQESLSCDWDAGTCQINPDLVRFCVQLSPFGGCP